MLSSMRSEMDRATSIASGFQLGIYFLCILVGCFFFFFFFFFGSHFFHQLLTWDVNYRVSFELQLHLSRIQLDFMAQALIQYHVASLYKGLLRTEPSVAHRPRPMASTALADNMQLKSRDS